MGAMLQKFGKDLITDRQGEIEKLRLKCRAMAVGGLHRGRHLRQQGVKRRDTPRLIAGCGLGQPLGMARQTPLGKALRAGFGHGLSQLLGGVARPCIAAGLLILTRQLKVKVTVENKAHVFHASSASQFCMTRSASAGSFSTSCPITLIRPRRTPPETEASVTRSS